jgi:hypothetical protein
VVVQLGMSVWVMVRFEGKHSVVVLLPGVTSLFPLF